MANPHMVNRLKNGRNSQHVVKLGVGPTGITPDAQKNMKRSVQQNHGHALNALNA